MTVSITSTPGTQKGILPIRWQLHGALHQGEPPQFVDLDAARFRIGRRPGLNLSLPSMQVSMIHAEFVQLGGRIFIRDLNSTNGTFVNGSRISNQDCPLRDGDRVRVGTVELRLMRFVDQPDAASETVVLGDTAKPFVLDDPATTDDAPGVDNVPLNDAPLNDFTQNDAPQDDDFPWDEPLPSGDPGKTHIAASAPEPAEPAPAPATDQPRTAVSMDQVQPPAAVASPQPDEPEPTVSWIDQLRTTGSADPPEPAAAPRAASSMDHLLPSTPADASPADTSNDAELAAWIDRLRASEPASPQPKPPVVPATPSPVKPAAQPVQQEVRPVQPAGQPARPVVPPVRTGTSSPPMRTSAPPVNREPAVSVLAPPAEPSPSPEPTACYDLVDPSEPDQPQTTSSIDFEELRSIVLQGNR